LKIKELDDPNWPLSVKLPVNGAAPVRLAHKPTESH